MEAAMSEKSVIIYIYIVSFCESIDFKKLKLFFIPFSFSRLSERRPAAGEG